MIEKHTKSGLVCIYDEAEAEEHFRGLRDRIFDPSEQSISFVDGAVFLQDHWVKVIIRGALDGSNRTGVPDELKQLPFVTAEQLEGTEHLKLPKKPYLYLAEWASNDPRDELQPLLELLVEDGVTEVIHMSPHKSIPPIDAITTRPTGPGIVWSRNYAEASHLQERLLFDRSSRWGFYGSEEEFGLLGGEPEFMERYIERAGGMDFIRLKADENWQNVLDEDAYEAPYVARYYDLAGWDKPPRRKESGGD